MESINKKVLIVEDDKDFSFILQADFRSRGFNVAAAGDGKEGLEMIDKEKPDLVILDILMPNMDGIEMAGQMKLKNIKIPVIFLTNMSDFNHISRAEEIIPTDYIIKSDMSLEKIVETAKRKLGIKQ